METNIVLVVQSIMMVLNWLMRKFHYNNLHFAFLEHRHWGICQWSTVLKSSIKQPPLKLLNIYLLNILAQSQPDIIVATETLLKAAAMSSEVTPPNYVAHRKDGTGWYGGVIMIIKSDLISEEITNISPITNGSTPCKNLAPWQMASDNWWNTSAPKQLHRLCHSTNRLYFCCIKEIRKAIRCYCGDFNLPDINW